MGMSMHDRYYEPEDDEYDDIDDYIADWVQFEMREGGWCDPKESGNFYEACSQLSLREDLGSWEEATPIEKQLIHDYWVDVAQHLAEEAYYESR